MKTRVLIVATSRKTRGGITSVIKAHETGEQWKKFHCHWVQTHRDGATWRKILYFIFAITDYLVRLPFCDIVHIHTASYGAEKRKRIFARLSKLFGKKLIVQLHSSPEFAFRGRYRNLYEYSFTHADKVVLLSNIWREEAIKTFNLSDDKIEVLYNPCPVVNPSKIEERELYILFAGTLTRLKGYGDLIKAFALIANKFPAWRLKLAGNGEIEKGKQLACKEGVNERVDFLGWVNGEAKDSIFRHASIYCLPSYTEGFPMGVLDAWAYGLPVVTTPVGGLPDVAIDRENTMLVSPGDIESLSEKLESLMSDRELYNKISDASANFAQQKFNITHLNAQLGQIYDSLK